MKVSELTGAALDWAVALIEYPEWKEQGYLEVFPHDLSFDDGTTYTPSTDWSQGGPIIEREKIRVLPWERNAGEPMYGHWCAGMWQTTLYGNGPTPLIAAMRCYCCSKLGETVEVPEELT